MRTPRKTPSDDLLARLRESAEIYDEAMQFIFPDAATRPTAEQAGYALAGILGVDPGPFTVRELLNMVIARKTDEMERDHKQQMAMIDIQAQMAASMLAAQVKIGARTVEAQARIAAKVAAIAVSQQNPARNRKGRPPKYPEAVAHAIGLLDAGESDRRVYRLCKENFPHAELPSCESFLRAVRAHRAKERGRK